MLSSHIDIQQGGSVSPNSKGRLTGFQAGTDLLATPNWCAGVYVGQLDGDVSVKGFARGVSNLGVARDDLRSQYVGIYGTYARDSGFYADAVVQTGRHRFAAEPTPSGDAGAGGNGSSLLGSIEVGQAFALSGSGWSIEPQAQLNPSALGPGQLADCRRGGSAGGGQRLDRRAGVRVKGEIDTGMGTAAVWPPQRLQGVERHGHRTLLERCAAAA